MFSSTERHLTQKDPIMKPTIALIYRPNVGKSTLFNRLTRTKDALVHDLPGLTRDRHYGHGKVGSKPYFVIDTGGFEPVVDSGILHEMAKQTLQAVDEADAVVFLVDLPYRFNTARQDYCRPFAPKSASRLFGSE